MVTQIGGNHHRASAQGWCLDLVDERQEAWEMEVQEHGDASQQTEWVQMDPFPSAGPARSRKRGNDRITHCMTRRDVGVMP